jgi:hypothetical protein
MKWTWMAVLALAAVPAMAGAESYPGTHISGRSGLDRKIKGTLVVDDVELRFQDKNGTPVFAVPIADVVEAG